MNDEAPATHSLLRVRVPRFGIETEPLRLPSETCLRDAILRVKPMNQCEHKTEDILQLIQEEEGAQIDCVDRDAPMCADNALLLVATRIFNSTFHPPEELSLADCMGQTLHSLGLFPSGTVTLLFADDDELLTSGERQKAWSIHVKPVHSPSNVLTVKLLRPLDTVHTLKSRIAVQRRETLSPAQALTLVASGRVLDADSTLVGGGLKDGATVICLRREEAVATPAPAISAVSASSYLEEAATAAREAAASTAAVPPPPRERGVGGGGGGGHGVDWEEQGGHRHAAGETREMASVSSEGRARVGGRGEGGGGGGGGGGGEEEDEDEEEAALCRICHGGEEHGPMLAPCMCAGSMRFVHLSCLNTWRRVAPSERSFTRCDQCGYAYRFERNRAAAFLLSDQGAYALALLACLSLLYGGAWGVELLLPLAWKEALFRDYAWRPAIPHVLFLGNRPLMLARWFPTTFVAAQSHLDFLSGGFYVFGSIGFFDFLREEVAFWRNHRHVLGWANPHSFMLLVWFASVSSSGAMGRVVSVIGFAASARLVVLAAHQKAKELSQSLGERMLEVTH